MKKLLAALVAFSFLASPAFAAEEMKKDEPAKTEKKAAKKKATKKAAKKTEEKKAADAPK